MDLLKGGKLNIVLTGGHAATTGMAAIQEIRKTDELAGAELYWIGSKTAIEGSNVLSLESKIFPKAGVTFVPIIAGKLQTKFTRHTIPAILKIPLGFLHAPAILFKIKPKAVLSFGGYSSFPIVFWAKIFSIPVTLHEQTVAAGRATITSSFFATKIAISRLESSGYFPKEKTIFTGNPLMQNILNLEPKTKIGRPPVLFIFGGSRGSNFLNELVLSIAPDILSDYKIIHITGDMDYERVNALSSGFPEELKKNYEIISSVDPGDMSKYYKMSDLIIARSGANTVSEILYVKRPTIFVPLPRTYMNEQHKNAIYAKEFGLARVLTETEAVKERVIKEIKEMTKDWDNIMSVANKKESPDKNAAKNLVQVLLSNLLK